MARCTAARAASAASGTTRSSKPASRIRPPTQARRTSVDSPARAAYRAAVAVDVRECDVVVVGAGPAGSTAAQLLAAWGHSVLVIHRATPAHLTLAESLPAST